MNRKPSRPLWLACLAVLPAYALAGVVTNPNTLLTQPADTVVTGTQGVTPTGGYTPQNGVPETSSQWHQVGSPNPSTNTATPKNPLVANTQSANANNNNASGDSTTMVNGVEYVKTGNGQEMAMPPLPTVDAVHQAYQSKRPLNPGQIRWVRRQLSINQQATQAPLSPVTPRIVGLTVHLDSGAPAAVALHAGYITTLNFTDAYGHPWKITHVAVDTKAVSAQYSGDSVALSVIAAYTQSNMAVWLQGEPQPVLLSLVPARGVADYAVHVRVDALEPGLPPPIGGGNLVGGYTNVLLSLTQDLPPSGAKPLAVVGNPPRTSAWVWQGPRGTRLLLRVPHPILAPAWTSRLDGAGGIRAYILPDVPSVTISTNGRPQTLRFTRLPGVGGSHD